MTRASSGDQSKAPGACVCRCEGLALRFQQRDADAAAWEEVPPGACCDYAWEEPQAFIIRHLRSQSRSVRHVVDVPTNRDEGLMFLSDPLHMVWLRERLIEEHGGVLAGIKALREILVHGQGDDGAAVGEGRVLTHEAEKDEAVA